MDAVALRDLCLSFIGSEETFPFRPGMPVFKVAGKMFALKLDGEPLSINLKCEPGLAEQLREAHAEIRPAWHMDKRHWITVVIDGSLGDETVRDLVEDSYDLVVSGLPRKRRAALLWRGDRPADPAS